MCCLYVSKVQSYIKSIFASPKWLNNGILLLCGTSWLQGVEKVLLGLLLWFPAPLVSPWQWRKWRCFCYIGKSDLMVFCSCFTPGGGGSSYSGSGGKASWLLGDTETLPPPKSRPSLRSLKQLSLTKNSISSIPSFSPRGEMESFQRNHHFSDSILINPCFLWVGFVFVFGGFF